jgi:hypothetical protein
LTKREPLREPVACSIHISPFGAFASAPLVTIQFTSPHANVCMKPCA